MSLMTWLSVIISCILWIGGISWLIVHAFGLSTETGWLIMGGLGLVTALVVYLLAYEVKNAIELPEDLEMDGIYPRAESSSMTRYPTKEVMPVNPLPAFRVSGDRF